MSPQHRVTHRRIYLIDDANQSFRGYHRTVARNSCARARAQNNRRLVTHAPTVQRFGRDESPFESSSDSNQLSEAIVLALERARLHGVERQAIEVLLLGVGAEQRLTAALSTLLKHHKRCEETPPHSGRNRLAHGIGERACSE